MSVYGLRLRQGHKGSVLQALKLAGIKITGLNPQQEDLQ